ncbi:MAG: hypothetical protein JSW70_02175 [Syntrophobacterales bacterium]|nr:MAG: hypothetical protein JSW70_02175 [Syntrophobacterales bacterium]
MQELSFLSQIILYVLLALIGLLALIVWGWQIMVLQGKAMKNPDGSTDDWHKQKTHYGIAFAEIFLACLSHVGEQIMGLLLKRRW